MSKKYSRRGFIEGLGSMAVGTMAGGALFGKGDQPDKAGSSAAPDLPEGATILFQGDSITDAGRGKDNMEPNNPRALGYGYAFLAAAELRKEYAAKNLQCYNRGISGNKVYQLADRWQEDCLDLEPDVLSILIGVNDYWHTRSGRYDGTPEVYYEDFRALLERTKNELPDVQLMIGQPYVLEEGSAVDQSWFPEFGEYRKLARKIATEFDATWIPYQEAYDAHSKEVDPTYWSGDGVHPSMAGAELMAQTWLDTFKSM